MSQGPVDKRNLAYSTDEGSAARLVRNTLTNGAGAVLGVVVFLILTPFLIVGLGAEAYGIFTLALAFSFLGGYAAFTDLGVEAATARYVAEARSEADHVRVNRLASTTLVFFASAALVIAPLIAGASFLLVDLFDIRGDLRQQAILCFALTGAQLLFEMPARTYFAVLQGAQRFTVVQSCQVARILTQAAMFVTVLVLDLGIGALGGALALSSLIVLVLADRLAHRAVPTLRISTRLASGSLLRTLLGYGGGVVGLQFLATAYRQTDRVIIGATLGPRFVTVYEIANKIQSAAQLVQSISASALVPAAAYARTRADVLQDMFLRGTTYTLAVSLPVVGAVVIFAEPLIRTWIDPTFGEAVGPTRLFAAYLSMTSILVVGTTMTVALGRLRFLLKLSAPALLINVLISLALVRPLGVGGVILGSITSFLMIFPLQLGYFLRQFKLTFATFVRRALLPQTPGLLVQSATAVPLLWLANRSDALVGVGLLSLVSIMLSLTAFIAVGLPHAHRKVLVQTLRAAIG